MNSQRAIEEAHRIILDDFKKLYVADRPSFKEIQAQDRAEAIQRIKNHLFATLLCEIIKKHGSTGNEKPVILNLQSLLEIIENADIRISIE